MPFSHFEGRKSPRLRGYDYSTEGSYFVTFNVKNRECVLGDVIDGEMIPSPIGDIVNHCWLELLDDFANLPYPIGSK